MYMTTYDADESQQSVRLRLASPVASSGVDNTGAHVLVDPLCSGSALRDLYPHIIEITQGPKHGIGILIKRGKCSSPFFQNVRTSVGPWSDLGRTLVGPWSDLGRTLVGPWSDLGRTLVGPWSGLGRTLVGPWSDLGRALV